VKHLVDDPPPASQVDSPLLDRRLLLADGDRNGF
jgi:hypothetical protein